MTLYTNAESNIRKTWLYLAGFLVFVIFLGWILSYIFNSYFIFWLALIYSFLTSFLGYWYSDKIVLSMSRAQPVAKEDNKELYRLVENLCITAGLPLPKIYIIPEAQPNAFAAGRDPKHAVVAVTQGLVDKLERAELEAVISHELSHIGNRDALLQTIVVVLSGIVVMMVNFFFRFSFRGGFSSKRDSRSSSSVNLIIMILGILLLVLAPLLATLIKLAISRKREFLADSAGALLTRYPEGLARALEKISQDPNPLRTANNSTAHLYIASPFRGENSRNWFSKLFLTHPPIEERVRALRELKI